MKNFDLFAPPLNGSHIIEASAGTGKTFSIEGLYLHFLIQGMEVRQILVVTYTEAATAELRERIHSKIRKALLCCKLILRHQNVDPLSVRMDAESIQTLLSPVKDPFLEVWIAQLLTSDEVVDQSAELQRISILLELAFTSFEEAAVYTIHAFCRKVLSDNLLESRSSSEFELVTDLSGTLEETVQDFWRKKISGLTIEEWKLFQSVFPDLSKLQELVKENVDKGNLKILPESPTENIKEYIRQLHVDFKKLREQWTQAKGDLTKRFQEAFQGNVLSATSYKKTFDEKIGPLLDSLNHYFESASSGLRWPEKFDVLLPEKLQKAVKKGKAFETPEICVALEGWKKRIEPVKDALKAMVLKEIEQGFSSVKIDKGYYSFDDLLKQVKTVLKSDHSNALMVRLRLLYKSVLIDEFQDTDPVQYEIFKVLFHEHCPLFFIGDPKQAIYQFRGADLATYLRAVKDITAGEKRFNLGTNFRSDGDMIRAVNRFFSFRSNPFLENDIQFVESRPPEQKTDRSLEVTGAFPSPFQLWYHGDEVPIKADQSREDIVNACSNEIVRLLNLGQQKKACIKQKDQEEWIKPEHIAVLVTTHREADLFQEALRIRRVASVIQTHESVLQTEEFNDIDHFLRAVSQPGRTSLIKRALITPLFGIQPGEMMALEENELEWEHTMNSFKNWHDLWNQKGFYFMIRQFMKDRKIRERFLEYENGERKLTNFQQITEILHRESVAGKSSIPQLISWIDHLKKSDQSAEENKIRLETDARALKIMTIHASKGLEFDIVFVPFAWRLPFDRGRIVFHDKNDDNRLTLDLTGNDENKWLSKQESLAEKIRLLYVAVTRAAHACYVICGHFNRSSAQVKEVSCFDYLLHDNNPQAPHEQKQKDLEKLAEFGAPYLEYSPMPLGERTLYQGEEKSREQFTVRVFDKKLKPGFSVQSFSGLTASLEHQGVILSAEGKEESIFTFPGGTATGEFFHNILENTSFSSSNETEIREIMERERNRYSIDPKWMDIAYETIQQVLNTRLDNSQVTTPFRLKQLPEKQVVKEMNFYFSLSASRITDWIGLLEKEAVTDSHKRILSVLRKIHTASLQGFMTGFVDMVFQHDQKFYIIDWKTNKLGLSFDDYRPDNLQQAMLDNAYNIQYFIYTIALHRFLKQRMGPQYSFEKYFGGVYYIFLRGVDGDHPGNGIYYDSLEQSNQLIETFDQFLTTGK